MGPGQDRVAGRTGAAAARLTLQRSSERLGRDRATGAWRTGEKPCVGHPTIDRARQLRHDMVLPDQRGPYAAFAHRTLTADRPDTGRATRRPGWTRARVRALARARAAADVSRAGCRSPIASRPAGAARSAGAVAGATADRPRQPAAAVLPAGPRHAAGPAPPAGSPQPVGPTAPAGSRQPDPVRPPDGSWQPTPDRPPDGSWQPAPVRPPDGSWQPAPVRPPDGSWQLAASSPIAPRRPAARPRIGPRQPAARPAARAAQPRSAAPSWPAGAAPGYRLRVEAWWRHQAGPRPVTAAQRPARPSRPAFAPIPDRAPRLAGARRLEIGRASCRERV